MINILHLSMKHFFTEYKEKKPNYEQLLFGTRGSAQQSGEHARLLNTAAHGLRDQILVWLILLMDTYFTMSFTLSHSSITDQS